MSHYSHLSLWEREQIAVLLAAGLSKSEIARRLGRPKSTIGREVKRNALASGRYSAAFGEGSYLSRRQRPARLERDHRLRQFVIDRLAEAWSPEQISGWLKGGHEKGLTAIATETIYAFIYRKAQKADELWRYLTRSRRSRRPMRARRSRDVIKNKASIHDRPAGIDRRDNVGHWEGDLMFCKRTRPVLVLHERKTRLTIAARLTGKTAAETVSSMMAVFKRLDPRLRQSVTFDNGSEFAKHELLRQALDMTTWFCDAYASWQKGGVENTNGRLRRWLPRHRDIDKLDDGELQDIVLTHNLTPRKCLGFKTPLQAMLGGLGKDIKLRFS